MVDKYLSLNDVTAYKIAVNLSNEIWIKVLSWDYFAKDTIGKQFVRAIDSISANIAEGFGRYNKKDKIRFYRYGTGSTKECMDWCHKAYQRDLISKQEYCSTLIQLKSLPEQINSLIKITNSKLTI